MTKRGKNKRKSQPQEEKKESSAKEPKKAESEAHKNPTLSFVADRKLNTNEFAMAIAELMRKKSSDPYLKVGCCILDGTNGRILSASYNGSVKGQHLHPNVLVADEKKRYLTCAERNTLHLQPSEFHDNRSIVVYTTLYPCESCTAILLQHNVHQIIHNVGLRRYYEQSSRFLKDAGVNVVSSHDLQFEGTTKQCITLKSYGRHNDQGFETSEKLDKETEVIVAKEVPKASITQWKEVHMSVAMLAAKRCDPVLADLRAGCCIVDSNNKILSYGFSGFPEKLSQYSEKIQEYKKMIITPIVNALSFAGDTKDAIIYCTRIPEESDIVACCQRGIKEIYYLNEFTNKELEVELRNLISEHVISLRAFSTKNGNYYEDIEWISLNDDKSYGIRHEDHALFLKEVSHVEVTEEREVNNNFRKKTPQSTMKPSSKTRSASSPPALTPMKSKTRLEK